LLHVWPEQSAGLVLSLIVTVPFAAVGAVIE
jgi:hypothetical protein